MNLCEQNPIDPLFIILILLAISTVTKERAKEKELKKLIIKDSAPGGTFGHVPPRHDYIEAFNLWLLARDSIETPLGPLAQLWFLHEHECCFDFSSADNATLMAKLEEQGPSTKGEETRIMGSTNNDSKGDDFIPFTNEAVHMLHAQ